MVESCGVKFDKVTEDVAVKGFLNVFAPGGKKKDKRFFVVQPYQRFSPLCVTNNRICAARAPHALALTPHAPQNKHKYARARCRCIRVA